jgi:hypothetical protein
MRLIRTAAATLLGVFAVTSLAAGHHSFNAQYDPEQPITIEGTVNRVEWRNPHIWVFLDVTEADGTVTTWQCEGGAPNALTRQGWTRQTLAIGGQLTLSGYRARAAEHVCNAREWTYEGRTVLAGDANDGGPDARPNR